MTLSEARGTILAHLPWGTEWLVSWVQRPLAKLPLTQGFAWQSGRDRQGWSLELSGATNTVMAGHASSLSCDIFFAGELNNRDELCGDLVVPADCRDAELVLSAWQAWGTDAFARIDGVFAIIVRDKGDGRLWAARDPMGNQPLFFAHTHGGLFLSDAVPVLLRNPSVSRDISRLKLAQRCFGYQGQPHETFYNSVYRVPPAHYLCATTDSRTLRQYWYLPEVRPPEEYSFDEARENFSRDFGRVVSRHLDRSPPSILLSGGLDSISVAKQATDICRSRGMPAPFALSLLFPDPDCDERPIQEAVARSLGLSQFSMSFDEAAGTLGLIGSALTLTQKLSSPLCNTWRPAYLSLINGAKRSGNGVILTGVGGDEWLGVSPLYMADLIKRGRFFSALRTLGEQVRSFNIPLHTVIRFQLWDSALRPLLVRGARPIVTGFAPSLARTIWRRRQHIPAWVAPDSELRAELRRCFEREIERQFSQPKPFPRGRFGFYTSDAMEYYIHPLVSSDREEDFEIGKMVGQRLLHPYWDAGLIRSLAAIPPEWLAYNGRSKGLIRGPIAESFPGLGLERKKKVSSLDFGMNLMRRELPPAWERLGGLRALYELGVVDQDVLDVERSCLMSSGNGRQLQRGWFLLNMESWVREKV
jgi:asparagine synthetase B (glutamine-hydrolysing)